MKKNFWFLFLVLIFTSQIFSQKKWNDRSFEIDISAPISVSNNLLTLNDVFQEVLLIDFTKIADEMPDSGFNTILSVKPSVSISLDIPKGIIFGVTSGIDVYSKVSVSKSLFEFLGYGNQLNQDVDIGLDGYLDTFAYIQADIGWNTKKFKIKLSPSVYSALFHATTKGSNFVISNSDKGDFSYNLNGNINLYSLFKLEDSLIQDIKDKNFEALGNKALEMVKQGFEDLKNSVGIDLKTQVEYDFTKIFTGFAKVNIPLIPASLDYVVPISVTSDFATSINDLTSGNFTAPSFTNDFGNQKKERITLNRPLKITLGGNFHAWNNVMEYTGSFGLGFDHPFSSLHDDVSCYVDYSLGMRVGLWDILNFYLSTERTDRIFIHKFMLAINLKFMEFDVGIASEASSLVKSFNAAGLGAFGNVKIGF